MATRPRLGCIFPWLLLNKHRRRTALPIRQVRARSQRSFRHVQAFGAGKLTEKAYVDKWLDKRTAVHGELDKVVVGVIVLSGYIGWNVLTKEQELLSLSSADAQTAVSTASNALRTQGAKVFGFVGGFALLQDILKSTRGLNDHKAYAELKRSRQWRVKVQDAAQAPAYFRLPPWVPFT